MFITNDKVYAHLLDLLTKTEGALLDLLYEHLSGTYSGSSISDLLLQFLQAKTGSSSNSIPDLWYAHLVILGYSGDVIQMASDAAEDGVLLFIA